MNEIQAFIVIGVVIGLCFSCLTIGAVVGYRRGYNQQDRREDTARVGRREGERVVATWENRARDIFREEIESWAARRSSKDMEGK